MSRRGQVLLMLSVVALVAWAPLAAVLAATAGSSALGCQIDEGSVHPCLVAGLDIGPVLYASVGVAGWAVFRRLKKLLG